MAVYGTQGFAEVLGHSMATFRLVPAIDGAAHGSGPAEVSEIPGFNMLKAELEAFAASIESGTPFPIPLDQIMHGVSVFEAVAASALRNEPVTVG